MSRITHFSGLSFVAFIRSSSSLIHLRILHTRQDGYVISEMIAPADSSTRYIEDLYYIKLTFLVGMSSLQSRLEIQWQE